MARYFMHLRGETGVLIDQEGIEYTNLHALRDHVMECARDVIAGDAHDGAINLNQHIDAETGAGTIIHTLEFEKAVSVERGSIPNGLCE